VLGSLTALTRLNASGNEQLSDGLQHLTGLGQLSSLEICGCSFTSQRWSAASVGQPPDAPVQSHPQ